MACNLHHDDRPMTVAQMFTYIRHRYGGMRAYYLNGRDVIAIPLSDDIGEAAMSLRELAVRKGLACSEVSAAWPELMGPEPTRIDGAARFLVISAINGKYLQPG